MTAPEPSAVTRPSSSCEPHDPVTEECDGCAPDAITRDLRRRQEALDAQRPYVQEFPCLPSLGEHCGECHRCTCGDRDVTADGDVLTCDLPPGHGGPHSCVVVQEQRMSWLARETSVTGERIEP